MNTATRFAARALSIAIVAALAAPAAFAGLATAPTLATDSTGYVSFCAEPAGGLTVCSPPGVAGDASAQAPGSIAIGPGSGTAPQESNVGAVALGGDAKVDTLVFGDGAPADGNDGGIAIGYQSLAVDAGVSVGTDVHDGGFDDIVVGDHATDEIDTITSNQAVIIGGQAAGSAVGGVVVGQGATLNGSTGGVVVGGSATSTGGIAIGYQANGGSTSDIAIGDGASIGVITSGDGSVALGDGSTVTRVNTVSVGNAATGVTRTISNVSAVTEPTDAVNLQQLDAFGGTAFSAVAAALGGGAAYDSTTGVFTAPSFTLSNPFGGGTFDNVGAALGALDGALSGLGSQAQMALSSAASAIGGGMSAGFAPGDLSVTQPSFVLKNPYSAGTYTSVGAALTALDTAVTDVPDGGAGGAAVHDVGVNNPGATASTDSNYTGGGAQGGTSVTIGPNATAVTAGDVALGNAAYAAGAGGSSAVAIGNLAEAGAGGTVAEGYEAFAGGTDSTAVGYLSTATANDATALGQGAVADQAGTVSVGSDGADGIAAFQRSIVNVAPGIGGFDAVNVAQLNAGGSAVAGWIGGGAAFNGSGAGTFTAPAFTLSNPYTAGTFGTVSGALQALDTGLTDAAAAIAAGGTGAGTGTAGAAGPAGPQGRQGAQGATGPQGKPGANGVGVVQLTSGAHATARIGTSTTGPEQARAPVVVQNVAAGAAGTDAVNVQQMKAGDAAAVKAANDYTDSVTVEYDPHSDPTITLRGKDGTMIENVEAGTADNDAATVGQVKATQNWANEYTNEQFNRALTDGERYTNAMGAVLNRRIDYALSSAMADSQAAAALSGQSRDEPNRIGVGMGDTAGVSALNVTYQHLIPGSHWAFNVGASVSAGGGEQGTTIGAGASYGW